MAWWRKLLLCSLLSFGVMVLRPPPPVFAQTTTTTAQPVEVTSPVTVDGFHDFEQEVLVGLGLLIFLTAAAVVMAMGRRSG